MPRFIVTGSFSAQAAKGFMDHPSDRWDAIDALMKAAGGKLETYYLTTGPTDFMIVATADDVKQVISAVMVAAGSGAISGMQTQQAMTTADFKEIHETAASIRAGFAAPGS